MVQAMEGHSNDHARSLRRDATMSSQLEADIELASLPAAFGGYVAKPRPKDGNEDQEFSADELVH